MGEGDVEGNSPVRRRFGVSCPGAIAATDDSDPPVGTQLREAERLIEVDQGSAGADCLGAGAGRGVGIGLVGRQLGLRDADRVDGQAGMTGPAAGQQRRRNANPSNTAAVAISWVVIMGCRFRRRISSLAL